MQSWTIGIICYNEKKTIRKVFEAVKTLLQSFNTPFEIILVDDASTDGSAKIIRDIAASFPSFVRGIFHSENQGIGAAIRDVYFNGSMENIVFVPGDGQFDVSELLPYKNFDRNNYVCFYRKENETYKFYRKLVSALNRFFNKYFLGLDLQDVNWVKVYKRAVIISLDLKSSSSVIESEICAKLNKLNIKPLQVASKYQSRVYGKSKGASIQNLWRVVREMIALFIAVKTFRPPIVYTKKTTKQL